jgi:hypothetical protein
MPEDTGNIVTEAFLKPDQQETVVYSISTGGIYRKEQLVEKIVFRGKEPSSVSYFRGFDASVLKEVQTTRKGKGVGSLSLPDLLLIREGALENLGVTVNPRTACGLAPDLAQSATK